MLIVIAGLLLASSAGIVPECEADSSMSATHIGPINLDVSASDIEGSKHDYTRSDVNIEGDLYPRYAIQVCNGALIEVTFDADHPYEISTNAEFFERENGARVGMSLTELEQLFPAGRVIRGYADGLYFVFVTDPGGVFVFNAEALGEDCVLPERQCVRDLGDEKSVSYFVRNTSPE